MRGSRATIIKNPMKRMLVIQFAVALLVTASAGILGDHVSVKSAALGALISVIPSAYFTHKFFRYQGARAAPKIVQQFYRAETGKFVVTAALFAAVFAARQSVDVIALFAGYVASLVAGWLSAYHYMD